MINFKLLGVAAVLSVATATPVLAQAAIQEPGLFAFYHPNGIWNRIILSRRAN